MSRTWKRRLKLAGLVLAVLIVIGGVMVWFRVFREVPQHFDSADEAWKYGSLGGESDRGIPYWIWIVMPRIFGDKLPGPGGWKSFGLAWEEGREVPIGFSLKTVGFPRITNNCALCHTGSYRLAEDQTPHYVSAGSSQTADIQGMLRFMSDCAKDPRFNADTILVEIDMVHKLDMFDRLLFRFGVIPMMKDALLEQGKRFEWMNLPGHPDWGPGRDDPMNLTKYFMTSLPVDDTVGQTDFPTVWALKGRRGRPLNLCGETPVLRSVVIDSALGLGAAGSGFLKRADEITEYLENAPAPAWPYPEGPYAIKKELAAAGKAIYAARCAECHEPGAAKTGLPADMAELGTDRERIDSWSQAGADQANAAVKELGIDRPGINKTEAYVPMTLEGAWMRAPYLHNGSVPNLRELLLAPEKRSKVFHRGCDIYDPVNVGYITSGPDAERLGFRMDTSLKGNGNGGHTYGTDLSDQDKAALLEYLKTL